MAFAYQTILINSRDGTQKDDTGSQFFVQFKDTVTPHRQSTVAVTSLIIPHSWYNIRTPYNTFQINESLGAITYTVTIPEGNYTVTLMDTAIEQSMTSASASSGNGYTFTASTNTSTGKLTLVAIGLTGSETVTMSFDLTPFNGHMLLGGTKGGSYLFTSVITQNTLPKFVSYSGVNIDYLTIRCPQIQPAFLSSQTGTRTTVLFSYPLVGASGDVESCSPDSLQHSPIHQAFTRLDFEILDQQGRYLDLQGAHIVLTLQLFAPFNDIFKQ
jgi:hypothetical protein